MEETKEKETEQEEVSKNEDTTSTSETLADDDKIQDKIHTTPQAITNLPEAQQDISNNNTTNRPEPPVMPATSGGASTDEAALLPAAVVSDPVSTGIAPAVQVHPRAAEDLPLILCSLSIDSLHCIASFLSPQDWFSFGMANHATNRVCNEVFRRVRMHGFRCATEVVSAWKLGQHADARELSALYTKTGVPIYPYSLGHSYHTLTWRMGIEAKTMEGNGEESPESDAGSQQSNEPMDRFYTERYDARLNDGFSSPALTYVEEKSMFWYQQENESSPANASRNPSAAVDTSRTLIVPRPPVLQAQGPAAAAVGGGIGVPVHFPDFRPIGSDPSLDAQRQSLSSSFADMQPTHARRPTVRVHRHLVDQHLLGRSSVDDDNGTMRTAPVSLSADFYHPFIAGQSSSSQRKGHANLMSSVNQRGDASSATLAPGDRLVPPIPTPPPSNEVTPAATPRREASDGSDVANIGDQDTSEHGGVARLAPIEPSLDSQSLRTPRGSQLEAPIFSPPQLQFHRSSPPGTPPRIDHPILSSVDLEIYSSSSLPPQTLVPGDGNEDLRNHLRTRFAAYQRRLDLLLADRNNEGVEECILDFWDEFFPTTANVHFYDRYTAVPRVSCLHKFLTRPCPKAIGVVQCEIERIKVHSKKKGVNMKGRLFPSYEYRLFIRDRRHSSNVENSGRNPSGEPRRDTILMVAKNRGKKHIDANESASSKKGVNNYYLFTPQQSDIDAHYNSVNELPKTSSDKRPNGASYMKMSVGSASQNVLLGRLQSNFIGTEFQIFSHEEQKLPPRASRSFSIPYSDSENELDYDSGVSSDTMSTSSRSYRRKKSRRKSRKSLRRRNADSSADQPQPIDEELPAGAPEKRRSLRRAVSLPVMPYSRSSRTSRRAIAHSIEPLEPQPVQFTTTEEEEGAITYTANLLGNRPRIMDVCIPKVSSDGVAGAEWKRYLDSCDADNEAGVSNKMLDCFKQVQARAQTPGGQLDGEDESVVGDGDDYIPPDDFGLLALQNRPPWWNVELGAFVLNFGGRVSVASVKNFQLCDRNDQDHIMLQFGRIQGRHSFTMDYQHPLTAVQAFAVAISSLQSKISFG